MTSQISRGSAGKLSVNANTIELSITEQSSANGDTPPTFDAMPTSAGLPPNIASMCGVWPGSVSVTVTANGAQISRMHATVAAHWVSVAAQPWIAVCFVTIDDVCV